MEDLAGEGRGEKPAVIATELRAVVDPVPDVDLWIRAGGSFRQPTGVEWSQIDGARPSAYARATRRRSMARVSTYLNFMGNTEEAFRFYQSVFGTDYAGPMMRMGDVPPRPGTPSMSAAEKRLIMHVELPITGRHVLMGTDALESMGQRLVFGTNVSINLEPDSRDEARRLFSALSHGGTVMMELQDMFWGGLFGSVTDRFGVQWMINCAAGEGAR